MGTVHAEITLRNAGDVINIQRGFLREKDLREIKTSAMVDTGAITLIINEEVQEKLGLGIHELREATLANNTKEVCRIADPVEIQWKKRKSICRPWVLPGSEVILLGAIPLGNGPHGRSKQELIGRHGDDVRSSCIWR